MYLARPSIRGSGKQQSFLIFHVSFLWEFIFILVFLIFDATIFDTKRKQRVEFPFELFYAQDWTEKLKCNSFDICRTKYPNAVTVSMWTGTWAGGSASKGEWRDSSNNSTITNYNITTEIANKIYLSGILDKELCYECIWKSGTGTACHRRMDYFIDRYRKDRKSAIDGVVNEYPPCRVTTINTTMSQDLGNKSKLLP